MINVEGYSTVSDGFVADMDRELAGAVPLKGETHTWLSGRLTSRPREVNAAFNF